MDPDVSPADPAAEEKPAEGTVLKKKVGMYVGYLGAGYFGFQRQKEHKSIEGELEAAICRAGGISEDDAGTFTQIHWSRCARTDKGVSAAANMISLQLLMNKTHDEMVEAINAQLPPNVHIWGFHLATTGFDARKFCDRRRYEYLLPLWALDPQVAASTPAATQAPSAQVAATSSQPTTMATSADSAAPASDASTQPSSSSAANPTQPPGAPLSSSPQTKSSAGSWQAGTAEEKLHARVAADVATSTYTLTEQARRKFNLILGVYTGTHNFHNYTQEISVNDPAAWRTMRQVYCDKVVQVGGRSYVRLVLHGNSFMQYQIRKMVGMALAVVRGAAPAECVRLALETDRSVHLPIAPATGLMLDEPVFEGYNSKWGASHTPLTLSPWKDKVEEFKMQVLYPHIAASGDDELWLFLHTLTEASWKFSTWQQTLRRRKHEGKQGRQGPPPWAAKRSRRDGAAAGLLASKSPPLIVGAQETYGQGRPLLTEKRHNEEMKRDADGQQYGDDGGTSD